MTYATNLANDNDQTGFMAILKPRKLITSWTLDSGTLYTKSVSFTKIYKIEEDGTELDEASDSSLSDGEWYYDGSTLYYDNSVTITNVNVVATVGIFLATKDVIFHIDPTDDTSEEIEYTGIIKKVPDVIYSTQDIMFGFNPSFAGILTLDNTEGNLMPYLSEYSFNKAEIDVYHLVGDFEAANISRYIAGFTGNITFDDSKISIRVFDRSYIFDQVYEETYDAPEVFGWCEQVPAKQLVNSIVDLPVGTYGYFYYFGMRDTGQPNIYEYTSFTMNSTTNTTITTTNFAVGDIIGIFSTSTDTHAGTARVTSVGGSTIDHTATTVRSSAFYYIVKFDFKNLYQVQNGVLTEMTPGTDYETRYKSFTGLGGNTFDCTQVMAINCDSEGGQIYADVRGRRQSATTPVKISGVDFGSNDGTYDLIRNPIMILLLYLQRAGVPDSEIDSTSFTTQVSTTDTIVVVNPSQPGQPKKTIKQIINEICQTQLLRLIYNSSNKWELVSVAPLSGTADSTVEDDEILGAGISGSIDYNQMASRVVVNYGNYRYKAGQVGDYYYYVTGDTALVDDKKYLHKILKEQTFTSLHDNYSDAENMADRLLIALSDRKLTYKVSLPKEFITTDLGDEIDINRDKIAGQTYSENSGNSASTIVVSKRRSSNQIELELEDQKAIEDKSGSW